jgi:hypothetical protein
MGLQASMERRVKEKNINPASIVSKKVFRYRCVFIPEQEAELIMLN